MAYHDAGLADDYWKQYYTPNEVEEILMGPGKEAAQVVMQAPCSVTIVRPRPLS